MTWNSQGIRGVQWSGIDGGRHEDYVDYFARYPDIKAGADKWMSDRSNTHWANYVRLRGGLFNDFQINQDYGLPTGANMWDYGYKRQQQYGYNNNRTDWKVLGSGKGMKPGAMAIGNDIYDFAKWHWENQGSNEGRTLRDMDDVRAEEAAAALAAQNAEIAAANAEQAQKVAQGQEASRMAMSRGGGSQTQTATGATTFKGSGADASKNRRGKGRGTSQLRRPYGSSSLAIASAAGARQQGTGLNIAGR